MCSCVTCVLSSFSSPVCHICQTVSPAAFLTSWIGIGFELWMGTENSLILHCSLSVWTENNTNRVRARFGVRERVSGRVRDRVRVRRPDSSGNLLIRRKIHYARSGYVNMVRACHTVSPPNCMFACLVFSRVM